MDKLTASGKEFIAEVADWLRKPRPREELSQVIIAIERELELARGTCFGHLVRRAQLKKPQQ